MNYVFFNFLKKYVRKVKKKYFTRINFRDLYTSICWAQLSRFRLKKHKIVKLFANVFTYKVGLMPDIIDHH